MTEPSAMTLTEPLEELRRRLIIVIVAILVGAVVGFVLSRRSSSCCAISCRPRRAGHQINKMSWWSHATF